MKQKFSNLIVLFLILLTGIVSCEKNKKDDPGQLDKVKKILEIEARMNALNYSTDKATGFMSVIGYSQYKDGQLSIENSGTEPGSPDSVVIDTAGYWNWITCATVTEIENEDGSHTTIYDYGDGCEEFGMLYKGKVTYIWNNQGNNYYSDVIYDHYYSFGVEMNGHSEYSFTSDGNSWYSSEVVESGSDTTVTIMPVLFNWSGTSTGHENVTMKYDDGSITFYRSDYENVWDSLSYKVIQGDFYYSSESEEYEYHYLVETPLITSYKCSDVWVPVSGVETITTTEGGKTEQYTLDYGDGTCDNLATLTQNGETSVIDFGELYGEIRPMEDPNSSPSGGRKKGLR